MTPAEQTARSELAKHLGPLTDPRYAPDPDKAERNLQEAVRKCWKYKEGFPQWIVAYIKTWEAQKLRGNKRTPSEGTEQRAVQDVVTGKHA